MCMYVSPIACWFVLGGKTETRGDERQATARLSVNTIHAGNEREHGRRPENSDRENLFVCSPWSVMPYKKNALSGGRCRHAGFLITREGDLDRIYHPFPLPAGRDVPSPPVSGDIVALLPCSRARESLIGCRRVP